MFTLRVLQEDRMEGSSNWEEKDWPEGLPAEFDGNSIEFSIGNPRVEHITGLVHLYRPEPIKDHSYTSPSSSKPSAVPANLPATVAIPEEGGNQICVMAIPPDMSVADFCQFCGAYLQHFQHIRVVRREPSQRAVCMVLITLDDDAHAQMFFQDFNNKPFSSLEPDVLCRLLFVKDVQIVQQGGEWSEHPPQGQLELPTCPVCLERLDEHISGIVTTVCNHRFHSSCLSKWADAGCPVCRYCVQPATSSSRCFACGTQADLWICLICGHVGCGRYRSGHASDHWKESQHCYAMELETQRVWDYVGDGYVHRLVQSKTDGMLVEVPSPHPICSTSCSRQAGDCEVCGGPSRVDEEAKQAVLESKLDAITLEYNHLLTTQLDSQRQYFEGLINQAVAEGDGRLAEANTSAHQARLDADAARVRAKDAERAKQALERKLGDANMRIGKLEKEREYLKSLSDALVNDQTEFRQQLEQHKKDLEKKNATIQDLQEQVRDLMVFIEAQKVVGEASEDVKGATLLPLPTNATRGRRRGRN